VPDRNSGGKERRNALLIKLRQQWGKTGQKRKKGPVTGQHDHKNGQREGSRQKGGRKLKKGVGRSMR